MNKAFELRAISLTAKATEETGTSRIALTFSLSIQRRAIDDPISGLF